MTRDESWFLQYYAHRPIWCLPGVEVPKRGGHHLATPKTMLTVFLGVDGVVLIDWLPAAGRFNNDYFCLHLVQLLAEVLHRR
jgi:hypothetical protein